VRSAPVHFQRRMRPVRQEIDAVLRGAFAGIGMG
jgi:hypothetical protein